jgi:hypothetical protein
MDDLRDSIGVAIRWLDGFRSSNGESQLSTSVRQVITAAEKWDTLLREPLAGIRGPDSPAPLKPQAEPRPFPEYPVGSLVERPAYHPGIVWEVVGPVEPSATGVPCQQVKSKGLTIKAHLQSLVAHVPPKPAPFDANDALDGLHVISEIIACAKPSEAWHRLARVATEVGYLTARLEAHP